KQWSMLAGRPVVRWSVQAMIEAGAAEVIVVIPSGSQARRDEALDGLHGWRAAQGGRERAAPAANGLALAQPALPVLAHDAARPLVRPRHVKTLLEALAEGAEAAAPALAVPDTLKSAEDGWVSGTVP